MELAEIYENEKLIDFYENPGAWLIHQGLNFSLADPWRFAPAPELCGNGIDSAYVGDWAGDSGLLICTSAGWAWHPANTGPFSPVELFSPAGRKTLRDMGFSD